VPIPYTLEKDEIAVLLRQLNGLILPGGGTTVFHENTQEFYRQRVYFALDTAKKINEEGIHFPVWGIGMGFQQIIMWASGHTIGATEVQYININRRIHWDYKVKFFFSERIEFGTNVFRKSS
jgi:gamma-glutamyl-gamma-aminobutyrate hydrolase PuuD